MNPKCRTCNAELTPGTSFCRQCGAAINHANEPESEAATTLLAGSDPVTTQRLAARPTGDRLLDDPAPVVATTDPEIAKRKSLRRALVAGAITVIAVVCILCVALVFTFRSRARSSANAVLVYPGAKTLMDMKYDDGSRAMTLETGDSLGKVEGWYQSSLRPSKVIRLTSGSVVLKNQNTTATLVVDDDKTNILIKMTP